MLNDPTGAAATVTRIVNAIRKREVTAREVVEASLRRIERTNGELNAVVNLAAERAIARAEALDERQASREPLGPLHGVPFTLKDGFDAAGFPTTFGSPSHEANVPAADSTVAARLLAAGAVLLGKSNVPPFLSSMQTDNPVFGRTNNPWDLERTPGGSSGGAGAAIAGGLVPFDIGSDLSGSIRIPASFCGVFGLKPTANRLPQTGHMALGNDVPRVDRTLGVVGPMARTAEDLALLARTIAGADGHDFEVPPVPWGDVPNIELRGLRVAFRSRFDGVPTAKEVSEAVVSVAKTLEGLGAVVVERDPGFTKSSLDEVWPLHFRCLLSAMKSLEGMPFPIPDLGPAPTVGEVVRIQHGRDRLIAAIEGMFGEIDVYLTPVTPTVAVPHAPPRSPMLVDGEPVESRFVDHYLYPFGFTGNPCVVVPCGISGGGLPLAVQLVGKRWGDERLLGIAAAVAKAAGGGAGIAPAYDR